MQREHAQILMCTGDARTGNGNPAPYGSPTCTQLTYTDSPREGLLRLSPAARTHTTTSAITSYSDVVLPPSLAARRNKHACGSIAPPVYLLCPCSKHPASMRSWFIGTRGYGGSKDGNEEDAP